MKLSTILAIATAVVGVHSRRDTYQFALPDYCSSRFAHGQRSLISDLGVSKPPPRNSTTIPLNIGIVIFPGFELLGLVMQNTIS